MTTSEQAPNQTPTHEDDRAKKVAHLFHMWQFLQTDTTALTIEEARRAQAAAHNDLHTSDTIDASDEQ